MNLNDKIRSQIKEIYEKGSMLMTDVDNDKKPFEERDTADVCFRYQEWYTSALPIIKQVLPERLLEFKNHYKIEKRDNKELNGLTYSISDYIMGVHVVKKDNLHIESFDNKKIFQSRFMQQLAILRSVESRLDSILSDITGLIQAELFDCELEASKELLKKGHVRAAGALAGVSLEEHLSNLQINHGIKSTKRNHTISDLNNTLKENSIIDVPEWRRIQYLGDIRNLCMHKKEREPTQKEVLELIVGVERVIKEVF